MNRRIYQLQTGSYTLHPSTLNINTVQRNHINVIFLLNVSAKLGHHPEEYVKYQIGIT
jgi:hypothetical protein